MWLKEMLNRLLHFWKKLWTMPHHINQYLHVILFKLHKKTFSGIFFTSKNVSIKKMVIYFNLLCVRITYYLEKCLIIILTFCFCSKSLAIFIVHNKKCKMQKRPLALGLDIYIFSGPDIYIFSVLDIYIFSGLDIYIFQS